MLPDCGRVVAVGDRPRDQRFRHEGTQAFSIWLRVGAKPGDDAAEAGKARLDAGRHGVAGEENLEPEPVERERLINEADADKQPAQLRLAHKGETGPLFERPERDQGWNGLKDIAQGARMNNQDLPGTVNNHGDLIPAGVAGKKHLPIQARSDHPGADSGNWPAIEASQHFCD